ncbi:hypothetical protein [Chryseobacterium flavum]|uniref:hypothetical protein n=1 Tax=Chryseobacterium flavum TaxID=415851 RepID=UPI0028AB730F|nr:hypothetical protein [Chryseobacterium flavum]
MPRNEFKSTDWIQTEDGYKITIQKEVPSNMSIIQVYKHETDGTAQTIVVQTRDDEQSVTLEINRDPFDGYAVIK